MMLKFGYTRGYADGYAACQDVYERQVALLTEQLSDARALGAAANVRADATFDQLMLKCGAAPVSAAAQAERHVAVKSAIDRHGVIDQDAFEEFPIGDQRGSYRTPDDARLEA